MSNMGNARFPKLVFTLKTMSSLLISYKISMTSYSILEIFVNINQNIKY